MDRSLELQLEAVTDPQADDWIEGLADALADVYGDYITVVGSAGAPITSHERELELRLQSTDPHPMDVFLTIVDDINTSLPGISASLPERDEIEEADNLPLGVQHPDLHPNVHRGFGLAQTPFARYLAEVEA